MEAVVFIFLQIFTTNEKAKQLRLPGYLSKLPTANQSVTIAEKPNNK